MCIRECSQPQDARNPENAQDGRNKKEPASYDGQVQEVVVEFGKLVLHSTLGPGVRSVVTYSVLG